MLRSFVLGGGRLGAVLLCSLLVEEALHQQKL